MSTFSAASNAAISRSLLRAHVEEALERPRQPLADVAAVVGAERHADGLEARPVVQLDQFRDQVGGRVAVIVGGEIGDADPVVLPAAASRKRRPRRLDAVTDESFGALSGASAGSSVRRIKVNGFTTAVPAEMPRPGGPSARPRASSRRSPRSASTSPLSACGMIGPDRDRPLVARDRFVMRLSCAQRHRRGKTTLRHSRAATPAPVEGGERFVVALELLERAAAVVVRLGIVRPQRQRTVVARQRLGVAAQALATRCRGCCAPRHSSGAAPAPARSWRARPRCGRAAAATWPRLLWASARSGFAAAPPGRAPRAPRPGARARTAPARSSKARGAESGFDSNAAAIRSTASALRPCWWRITPSRCLASKSPGSACRMSA